MNTRPQRTQPIVFQVASSSSLAVFSFQSTLWLAEFLGYLVVGSLRFDWRALLKVLSVARAIVHVEPFDFSLPLSL